MLLLCCFQGMLDSPDVSSCDPESDPDSEVEIMEESRSPLSSPPLLVRPELMASSLSSANGKAGHVPVMKTSVAVAVPSQAMTRPMRTMSLATKVTPSNISIIRSNAHIKAPVNAVQPLHIKTDRPGIPLKMTYVMGGPTSKYFGPGQGLLNQRLVVSSSGGTVDMLPSLANRQYLSQQQTVSIQGSTGGSLTKIQVPHVVASPSIVNVGSGIIQQSNGTAPGSTSVTGPLLQNIDVLKVLEQAGFTLQTIANQQQ